MTIPSVGLTNAINIISLQAGNPIMHEAGLLSSRLVYELQGEQRDLTETFILSRRFGLADDQLQQLRDPLGVGQNTVETLLQGRLLESESARGETRGFFHKLEKYRAHLKKMHRVADGQEYDRDEILRLHERGKLAVVSTVTARSPKNFVTIYSPGVGEVSDAISKDPQLYAAYTALAAMMLSLSEGTSGLGQGDIGPFAVTTILEGKCNILIDSAMVQAFPMPVNTRHMSPEEAVAAIMVFAPFFGAIKMEDFMAPRCFEIEERLIAAMASLPQHMQRPVMHDDQHGTAQVLYGAALNALKVRGMTARDVGRVAFLGAGASAIGSAELFTHPDAGLFRVEDIFLSDRQGVIGYNGRMKGDRWRDKYAKNVPGIATIDHALDGAGLYIGVGAGEGQKQVLDDSWGKMAPHGIVFAIENPKSTLPAEKAKEWVPHLIYGNGRADNIGRVLNNAHMFPGNFRAMLDLQVMAMTAGMKIAAGRALAAMVPHPTPERLLPDLGHPLTFVEVAHAVGMRAQEEGVARERISAGDYRQYLEDLADQLTFGDQLLEAKEAMAAATI